MHPRTDDDPFLTSAEVASRISTAFPKSLADEASADAMLLAELDELEANGAPAPILQGHRHLIGNTICIEVCCSDNSDIGVRFIVYPDSPIDVYSIRTDTTVTETEQLRRLVASIASELKYDTEFR